MADDDLNEEGTEEEESSGAGKSKKKVIIIIAAVLVVVLVAVLGLVMVGGGDAEDEGEPSELVRNFKTFELDPFIVNLSGVSNYLKTTIIIEYDADILHQYGHGSAGGGSGAGSAAGGKGKGSGMPPLFAERSPMIKDAIITVLSSKKPQDVLTVEGKELLKDELIEAINEAIGLVEGPVVGLYFREFILQ